MQGGTSQSQRCPAALLDDAYLGLDERELATLIASTAAQARTLAFVDAEGRRRGHWGELLEGDEAVLLARLICLDLQAAERDLLQAHAAQDHDAMAVPLRRLRRELQRLSQGLKGHALALPLARLAEPLHRLGDWPRQDSGRLRQAFFSLRHGLAPLQPLARAALQQSLRSGRHEPAAALLLAVLQLYQRWQAHTAGLHGARIRHYYRDQLGLAPLPAEPPHLHLVLEGQGEARAPEDAAAAPDLPAGTLFAAAPDTGGRVPQARSRDPLWLSGARVEQLHTLHLDRDPRTSPERSFGMVSEAHVCTLPAQRRQAWPLFGDADSREGAPARLGLAIASPLLALCEGERLIELRIGYEPPQGIQAVVDRVLQAPRERFPAAMGELLRHWLFADEALSDDRLAQLRDRAQQFGLAPGADSLRTAGDPLCLLAPKPAPDRALMRDLLLRRLFQARLSGAQGWLTPAPPSLRWKGAGWLSLSLRLDRAAPAVVPADPALHPGAPAGAPLLQLWLGERVRIYPLSLFEALLWRELRLSVKVEGLRQLQLHNQLGELDPGKPLQPFGPLPDPASQFIIGAAELAAKPLQSLSLRLSWSGLPSGLGAFAAHYASHGVRVGNGDFAVRAAVLRHGEWEEDESQPLLPLFSSHASGSLMPEHRLVIPDELLRERWLPESGDVAARYSGSARGGFLRLRLAAPADGLFGHARYAQLLTEVLSHNARPRWRAGAPLPMPSVPYTPLLARLSLDYRASMSLRLADAVPDTEPHAIWHLRPLGQQKLWPSRSGRLPTLLPHVRDDGSLAIGLSCASPQGLAGPLSLLFELDPGGAREQWVARWPQAPLHWAAWQDGRWQALEPRRVLRDSTAGMLRSGVVLLDLPPLPPAQAGEMPEGLVWLRLASPAPSARFAGLLGVRAQALQARQLDGGETLPAGRFDQARIAQAPLRAVQQPHASFGGRPAEDEIGLRTRVSERLRHRQRACQAWDFERLVLRQFPEVERAACLTEHEAAGVVTLVVIPHVARNQAPLATQAAALPVALLRRIEEWLRPLASPFVRLSVRNAGYERLQLRAALRLHPGVPAGALLRRAHEAVQAFLSPWCDSGLPAQPGWVLRVEDLAGLLRSLPEVAAVGAVSVLKTHIDTQGRHWLHDSARHPGVLLRAADPASLPLPADGHLLQLLGSDPPREAQPSSLGDFGIGSSFVIGTTT